MMQIVICEDDAAYCEEIEQPVTSWTEMTHHDVRCLPFASTEELLEQWENGLKIDLLFLDIQIPGEIDGMALARKIRETNLSMTIVFVTNYTSYVYEGYTVNALRFLRKPVQKEDVFDCLEIAYRQHAVLKQESIAINARNGQFVVHFDEIVYIEACLHYLRLHLSHTDSWPEVRMKLTEFIPQLPTQLFVQCHRGLVVNVMHIRKYTSKEVTLSSGAILPISPTYLKALKAAFDQYYQKE